MLQTAGHCLPPNEYVYFILKAECPFIDFTELLDRLEDLVVDTVDRILKSPLGYLVRELNPDFKPPR